MTLKTACVSKNVRAHTKRTAPNEKTKHINVERENLNDTHVATHTQPETTLTNHREQKIPKQKSLTRLDIVAHTQRDTKTTKITHKNLLSLSNHS